ncbi:MULTISPECIES: SHOCT domain-containing protein [Natronococcus]|uniref:SHOCT domain-containing protein n=1 Tax=Natronococcus TaxID=29287 RepID=UPI00157721F0|nr:MULTISPECIES: SHOCT domain-containing protein [Natronococcus]MDG5821857.1 SHOCT domain-containing protein [Natronococcus sp. A-GB7]
MHKPSRITLFAASLGIPLILVLAILGSIAAAGLATIFVILFAAVMAVATQLSSNQSQIKSNDTVSTDSSQSDATDPFGELQDQYAKGELTEVEFEQRVEVLLETEHGYSSDDQKVDSKESEKQEPAVERE